MRAAYKDLMHLNSQVIEEMHWLHDEMHQWSGKAIISAICTSGRARRLSRRDARWS